MRVKMFSESSAQAGYILGQNVLWNCQGLMVKAGVRTYLAPAHGTILTQLSGYASRHLYIVFLNLGCFGLNGSYPLSDGYYAVVRSDLPKLSSGCKARMEHGQSKVWG